jgi:predicted DNA-binding transcriptional regulator YafY
MTDRVLANAQTYLDVVSHKRIAGTRPHVSLVCVAFANLEVALREAFGYNEEAVVVDPPALRERLLERARALAARYDAPA